MVVGDVVGLPACEGRVQRRPDAELGQDILAAVVAEDGVGAGGAGEGDGGVGAVNGGVTGQVEGLLWGGLAHWVGGARKVAGTGREGLERC